jgi:energy-coupling factor transporter ATP-binding protein EcfA2
VIPVAKQLLQNYRIAGDVIDAVTGAMPGNQAGAPIPVSDTSSSGTDEPPPAGATPEDRAPEAAANDDGAERITCRRDGLFLVFAIGGTTYRIGGVKPLFVTSLRVNIRASNGEVSYYDSIDLYAARGRTSFAQAVNRTWGAEPARIERDLVMILEYLEKDRDDALKAGTKRESISMSESERTAGLELLRDPRLFDRIAEDLATLGYVGENLNKQLLYLCASSRKLDDPISVLILSQSASGKSFLVDCVKRLMPPEEVVAVTSLSDQALNYIDDLTHKFLVLGEAVHGEVVEYQIREMLSGKELSRLVTIKDPETGKMQSRVVRTPVIVSSVMSGTNHAINPENASRCFVVNTDESREQTERIQKSQREKYSLERIRSGSGHVDSIIRAHRAAQRLLEKRKIVNEFAPYLDFPTSLMRTRRDHDRFLDLIACVCFVRQFQKPEERAGSVTYLRCDLDDYRIAYRIMVDGVLSSTLRELPAGVQLLYGEIRALARKEAARQKIEATEVSMTQRQIREHTGQSQQSVKMGVRQLLEYEYLTVMRGGGERSKGFYRLKDDAEIGKTDLSMIPTPEAMARKIGVEK